MAIDTARGSEHHDLVDAGDTLTIGSRSVLVLQEWTEPEAGYENTVDASIASYAEYAEAEAADAEAATQAPTGAEASDGDDA